MISDGDTHRILTDAVQGTPVTTRVAHPQPTVSRSAILWTQIKWLKNISKSELAQLYSRRSSLSVIDFCLMFGNRVVIPSTSRQLMPRQFISSDPIMGRMKAIAHSFAFFPPMDKDRKHDALVFPLLTSSQIPSKRGTYSMVDAHSPIVQNSR